MIPGEQFLFPCYRSLVRKLVWKRAKTLIFSYITSMGGRVLPARSNKSKKCSEINFRLFSTLYQARFFSRDLTRCNHVDSQVAIGTRPDARL